jgi:hypothetical protein
MHWWFPLPMLRTRGMGAALLGQFRLTRALEGRDARESVEIGVMYLRRICRCVLGPSAGVPGGSDAHLPEVLEATAQNAASTSVGLRPGAQEREGIDPVGHHTTGPAMHLDIRGI